LVKNKLVFPAFYGASAKSIAGYLTGAFGCEVAEDFVDDILDKFWHVLSGMKRWQDKLVKQYYEVGYVTTLGGRKHRYPLNPNQVINHPFQGTAAELVSDAMVRLSYLAVQTGEWHLHPVLNIHDDLTFFVPENKLYKALEVIIKEMLVFDFPWVNVPLSLEISVGHNWYDLKPLGKFFSHKEYKYPHEQLGCSA
jgi:DNA polymerase-1